MAMKFSTQIVSASKTLPLRRREFLEEILRGDHGRVDNCWFYPGHVFIAVNQSSLYTFDCMPSSLQQLYTFPSLDLTGLSWPILDVQMTRNEPATFLIISASGHVQCWEFSQHCWRYSHSFTLGSPTKTLVTPVCVLLQHASVYWCERFPGLDSDSQTCCVLQDLPEGADREDSVGPAKMAVSNCPLCCLFPLKDSVLLVTCPAEQQVQVSLCLNLEPSLCQGFVEDNELDLSGVSMQLPVNFMHVLNKCLAVILQIKHVPVSLGVKQDLVTGDVVSLSSGGHVRIFSCRRSHQRISLQTVELPDWEEPEIVDSSAPGTRWFASGGLLGTCTTSGISLYSLRDGHRCGLVRLPANETVTGIIPSFSRAVLAGFLSSSDLYLIQRGATSQTAAVGGEGLPERKHFQTDTLHLAQLMQKLHEPFSTDVLNALNSYREAWKTGQRKQNQTPLSKIVEPYVSEFWHLEDLVNDTPDQQLEVAVTKVVSVTSEVLALLSGSSSLPLSEQRCRLAWLCETQPVEALEALSSALEFPGTHFDQFQNLPARRWEALLGRESCMESSLAIFEQLCRLLFIQKPGILVKFVTAAQDALEQSVGVSAFIRKKHTFHCYRRALDCLPKPKISVDPLVAAGAAAHLILTCDSQADIAAIQYLLLHQAWQPALDLLERQQQCASSNVDCLIFLTVTALIQHQVFTEYSSKIFKFITTWERFLSLCESLEEQPQFQQEQLSLYSGAVFVQHEASLSISRLRPCLFRLLHHTDAIRPSPN